MSGLTLTITAVAGSAAHYQISNTAGATISAGVQRIHRARRDAKPKRKGKTKR